MVRLSTAFRAFFACLFSMETALQIQNAMKHQDVSSNQNAKISTTPSKAPDPAIRENPKPAQSAAITLLATLQREARLIDFLKEDLSEYSDDQVGAAVREIQRESHSVLDRCFAIRPILNHVEGSSVNIPVDFDAARFRMTGNLTDGVPQNGILRHHGWEATKCELPEFIGSSSAAKTIAPAEVEVK